VHWKGPERTVPTQLTAAYVSSTHGSHTDERVRYVKTIHVEPLTNKYSHLPAFNNPASEQQRHLNFNLITNQLHEVVFIQTITFDLLNNSQLFCKLTAHYHVHKIPQLGSVLIQMNPDHIFATSFFKEHFNIIIWLQSDLFVSGIATKLCIDFSYLPYLLRGPPISSCMILVSQLYHARNYEKSLLYNPFLFLIIYFRSGPNINWLKP
jgi:hypothetical protein